MCVETPHDHGKTPPREQVSDEVILLFLVFAVQCFFLFGSIYLRCTGRSALDRLATYCLYALGLVGYVVALYRMPRLRGLPEGERVVIVSIGAIGLAYVLPMLVVIALFVSGLLSIPGL